MQVLSSIAAAEAATLPGRGPCMNRLQGETFKLGHPLCVLKSDLFMCPAYMIFMSYMPSVCAHELNYMLSYSAMSSVKAAEVKNNNNHR